MTDFSRKIGRYRPEECRGDVLYRLRDFKERPVEVLIWKAGV